MASREKLYCEANCIELSAQMKIFQVKMTFLVWGLLSEYRTYNLLRVELIIWHSKSFTCNLAQGILYMIYTHSERQMHFTRN